MRHIRLSIMAAAILFSGTYAAKAQTADDIIQKHINAIGGLDNWKKVNSMKLVGSANGGGTEIPITLTIVKNKAMRMDMTLGGINNYQIVTTKEGWMYFPIQGQQKPEAIPEDLVKKSQDELDLESPLMDYKTKGYKVEYLGKDEVEGTECYKLKLTLKDGKEETDYIDASNFYHIRSITKATVNGKEMEQTANFSNFKKLPEGIVFAMTQDQGQGAMNIKEVQINKPIDESIFKPAADSKK